MYIVSARKYRPDSFASLIGQDVIVRTLKNSIIRGQLAHAYLFCGPRGVGKTSAARIFAKMINCEHPTADMEPCGECESCRSFQEGRSYCIHELDAASNNSVEDIKALIEQVNIPPQVGKYSVFIVDEVHMLSSQAFNAFLKTLEEPPAHAIFILATTEKHKILPTILSRCQTYDFNRISIADMVRNLRMIADKEGITVDDESLHVIAMKADGAMRDALTIFDQTVAFCGTEVKYEDVLKNLNVLSYEHSFALVDFFLEGNWQGALLKFSEVLAKGFNALHFVSALSSHLRDLIVAKNSALDALLEFPASLKERYREQAERCSMQFLYDALSVTSACEAGYRTSVNPKLHIEFALMRLSFLTGKGEVNLNAARTAAAPARPVAGSPAQTAAPAQAKPVTAAATEAPAPARPVATAAAPAQPEAVPEKPVTAAPAPEKPETAAATVAPEKPEAVPAKPAETAAAPADGHKPENASAEAPAGAAAPESSAAVSEGPAAGEKAADSESPAPAEKPVVRQRTRTAPKVVISPDTYKPVAQAAAPEDNSPIPSDDAIRSAWKDLAELYKSRERLYQTLCSSKIGISDNGDHKLLTFNVINLSQKKWIEDRLLHDLEKNLCRLAGSGKVRICVEVLPEEAAPKKAYMPSEQAVDLMNQNPEVRDLVKDFGLDTK